MERRIPTKEEVLAYLKDDRNWGREPLPVNLHADSVLGSDGSGGAPEF